VGSGDKSLIGSNQHAMLGFTGSKHHEYPFACLTPFRGGQQNDCPTSSMQGQTRQIARPLSAAVPSDWLWESGRLV
jgi:hypothetical protein